MASYHSFHGKIQCLCSQYSWGYCSSNLSLLYGLALLTTSQKLIGNKIQATSLAVSQPPSLPISYSHNYWLTMQYMFRCTSLTFTFTSIYLFQKSVAMIQSGLWRTETKVKLMFKNYYVILMKRLELKKLYWFHL